MRPMRSFGGRGGGFGFPSIQSMAAKLTLGLVAGSVLFLATKSGGGPLLLLVPDAVQRFFLWQPLTYAFIEADALGIIFGALIIYSIGGFLESTWGAKRLLLIAVGGTALAGVLTVLVDLVTPVAPAFTGGTVMASILWVTYGLVIGRGQANFWGIPLSGNMLALIGAGFVLLRTLQVGWAAQLPDLFGLVIAFGYVRGGSPRRLWLHLQHWRLQRQLRNRSRNLRVVSSNRSDDQYLN
ncbi:rhomboid family intramembrane serine protease [Hyalangium rubrum]|uniref:Rhomboid family intramembrane serine protease n=1 Tax=Hyalangium rubrum TaxID=3103134 RepID=A0ABU5HJE9_9BACT|nr:rhomboid family intramembrane serine protease [Hyalangium sp. s54d21]MDY7233024.1 rhomboid family intramembrane serine protease [Hyalangium sp. s54d21]